MTELIDKNIGLQNMGFTELESWTTMLRKSQLLLSKSYHLKDTKLITKYQSDVDFIQKQIIRLRAIS